MHHVGLISKVPDFNFQDTSVVVIARPLTVPTCLAEALAKVEAISSEIAASLSSISTLLAMTISCYL
jgi:hypothetical protein